MLVPMTSAEGPRLIGVFDMVMAGALGVRVVPSMEMPDERSAIGCLAIVVTGWGLRVGRANVLLFITILLDGLRDMEAPPMTMGAPPGASGVDPIW